MTDEQPRDLFGDAEAAPLDARSFTAWPGAADLSTDAVRYGPGIATEAELRLIGPTEGRRVLELGCGGGTTAVALAKQGALVIAVDESAEQLAHARRLAEQEETKVELHQGDLADLAFVRADTIDAAISIYALGVVNDLDRVYRQVHRVLRSGAPFVLSLPHPAFRMFDTTGDPPSLQQSYFDRTPRPWNVGDEAGSEFPRTIHDVFTGLTRANFRVDTLLEPEPSPQPQSRGWVDAMRWVPSTLVVRARKEGI